MLNIRKQEENMLKKSLLLLLSILIVSGVCFAQGEAAEEPVEDTTAVAAEESGLVLEDIAICTAVEDRQPTGVGTVFPDDLDKIYCFTKIGGAEDTTYVTHVWCFGDKEIIKVNLPIKSVSWRTWSSKMVDMGLGKGYVEIVSEDGTVLGKAEFEIQAAGEETEETEAEEPETEESEEAVTEEE
jgi:hypothetical protein